MIIAVLAVLQTLWIALSWWDMWRHYRKMK